MPGQTLVIRLATKREDGEPAYSLHEHTQEATTMARSGEYSFTRTGFTLTETSPSVLTHVTSFEGSATEFNAPFGSLSYSQPLGEGGASSGTCTWVAKTVLEDGTVIADIAHGTFERIGMELRIRIKLDHDLSDGRKRKTEGILNHADGSWTGTYEEVS